MSKAAAVFEKMALTPEEEADQRARAAWMVEENVAGRPADTSQVELDVHLDSLLERGRSYMADMARNRAVYDRKKAELDEWLARVQGPLEQKMRWLDGLIMALAPYIRFTGRSKSRALPNGRIGRRARPAHIEIVDEAAAVAFAKKHKLQVKESVLKTPLMEYVQKKGVPPEDAAGFRYIEKDEEGELYWNVEAV